jgi:SAM-dependent methyltransferase
LRYFYTDIGLAFVQMARQQFNRSLPHIDFATYNIERGPESQGFEPHSMDVVLASNVLHSTRRIATTVDQCHQLLKSGGILVINELTYRLDYNTMTFGLTEDWWLYEEDDPRIAGSPLLDFATWRDVLHRSGFVDVAAHGVPGLPPDEQAQCVIVATRAADSS